MTGSSEAAPPGAALDSADRRIALRVATCVFVTLVGFSSGHFNSSDATYVFDTTRALYQDGSLAVGRHKHAARGADGRLYSHYAIGMPVLALPFYATGRLARAVLPVSVLRALSGPSRKVGLDTSKAGGLVEIFIVCLYSTTVAALLAAVFFLFERSLGASRRASAIASLGLALVGYPAMMSVYFLRHSSEGLALLGGLWLLHRFRWSGQLVWLAAGSGVAALAFLLRAPSVIAAPGIALYVLGAIVLRARSGERIRGRTLLAVVAPLAVVAAVHVALNYARWGVPLASPMTEMAQSLGTGMGRPLRGFLLSPGISVFAYSPLLLLLPWTLWQGWREHRLELVAILTIALTHLFYVSAYEHWTGLLTAPGPRYLFSPCVLLMLFLGPWLAQAPGRARLVAVVLLGAAGAAVQIGLMAADWGNVAATHGYLQSYEPALFDLARSPIVAHWRLLLAGHVDLWLWKLAIGWTGQPPHPGIAALLFATWLAAVAYAGNRVLTGIREAA